MATLRGAFRALAAGRAASCAARLSAGHLSLNNGSARLMRPSAWVQRRFLNIDVSKRSAQIASPAVVRQSVVNALRLPGANSLVEKRAFSIVGHVPRNISAAVASYAPTSVVSRRDFSWWNKLKETISERRNQIDPKTGKPIGFFRGLIKEYGMVGVGTYLVIDITCLGATYAAFKSGIDVGGWLDSIGISHPWLNSNSSTFVLAYAFYKILAPLRLGLAIAITPTILRKLRSLGWVKSPPPSLPAPKKPKETASSAATKKTPPSP